MMKRIVMAFGLVVLFGALSLQPGAAQQPTPTPSVSDDQVNAVARQLYCPVCENVPLDVCPTQACAEWRELIREQIAQGMTTEQIKDYFVNRFGARVLSAPPAAGFNRLAYLAPPAAILVGMFILWHALRMWRKLPDPAHTLGEQPFTEASGDPSEQDPYLKRIDDELHKL